jgi:hypothetical protein
VFEDGETVRRRIDVADNKLDFPILHDLKAEGATDYFALPVKNSFGTNYMATYVTDRIGGFYRQGNLGPDTGIATTFSVSRPAKSTAYRQQYSLGLSRRQNRAKRFWPGRSVVAWVRRLLLCCGRQTCVASPNDLTAFH